MLEFFLSIINTRGLLWSLTKNDFKQKYLGNILGISWTFIQPTATVLIFWFVFQVGFKSQPVGNFPFILWLMAGMFPWFFFAEGLASGTNSILSNSFLAYNSSAKINPSKEKTKITGVAIHTFFIFFMFAMFIYYGYSPQLYWLQIIYYLFATIVLLLGLSWITSSIVVFFKDIGQFVTMLIQFGFWLTPIFWNMNMVPEKYHWIIELNPMVYIIEGYRNSMIYNTWFWEDINMTLYFWATTLTIFFVGGFTFKKLRPHFADVL